MHLLQHMAAAVGCGFELESWGMEGGAWKVPLKDVSVARGVLLKRIRSSVFSFIFLYTIL